MDSTTGTAKSRPKSLLDFPWNIRLKIYSYAVEPFVLFTHTQRENLVPRSHSSHHSHHHNGTAGLCLPSRDWEQRPRWRHEDDWNYDPTVEVGPDDRWSLETNKDQSWDEQASAFKQAPHHIATLGYRISTYSPLLAVNKQLSDEVSNWIRTSGLQRSIHTIIRPCIFGDTLIPSLDPGFAPIFEHSRLILSLTADLSISFLQRMPSEVRKHIHSVILMHRTTQWDDGSTRLAWSKKKTERYAAYTEALYRLLPSLREVAIHVPVGGPERDMFCTSAPVELADMLLEGMVDTVRFLYAESCGARILDDDTTLEAVQAAECLACGKRQSWMEGGTLKRCVRCLKASYCSPTCQKTDWKSHRAWCKVADESEKRKPRRDPRLPRFDAVLEEHIGDSDRVVFQTAPFPRNQWLNYKTVVALRRTSDS